MADVQYVLLYRSCSSPCDHGTDSRSGSGPGVIHDDSPLLLCNGLNADFKVHWRLYAWHTVLSRKQTGRTITKQMWRLMTPTTSHMPSHTHSYLHSRDPDHTYDVRWVKETKRRRKWGSPSVGEGETSSRSSKQVQWLPTQALNTQHVKPNCVGSKLAVNTSCTYDVFTDVHTASLCYNYKKRFSWAPGKFSKHGKKNLLLH